MFIKKTIFISIFLFSSCSSQEKNSISIFNGISFLLSTGEYQISKSTTEQESFKYFFPDSVLQCPLYSVIGDSSKSYKLFINIPLNIGLQDLITYFDGKRNQDSTIVLLSDSSSYLLITEKSDITSKVRLFKKFGEDLINLNVICLDTIGCDSLMHIDHLTSRFKHVPN